MQVTSSLPEMLTVGGLRIHPHDGLLVAGGRAVALSVREFDLLVVLAARAGTIVRRDELFRMAWGRPLRLGDRSIDVYVHKLRAKLDAAVPGVAFIHTHVGFGYRLDPEPLHDVHTRATGR